MKHPMKFSLPMLSIFTTLYIKLLMLGSLGKLFF
jgi:hypothetical protein